MLQAREIRSQELAEFDAARTLTVGWTRASAFWLLRTEPELHYGQRGEDGGFGAKDYVAEEASAKLSAARGVEFGVGPAAFGADGERGSVGFDVRWG